MTGGFQYEQRKPREAAVKYYPHSRPTFITVRRYALHGLRDRNSVSPSVRLSHSCTVSTWFDLRS